MKIPNIPVKNLLIIFLIIYVGVFVVFCPLWDPWLVDSMVFHPTVGTDSAHLEKIDGVEGKEVHFAGDLTGWLYRVPGSKYVVLFTHGNAGNIMHRKDKIGMLLSCKNSVFIWDYHGFGNSGGSPSLNALVDDVTAAYDFLISQGYRADQIVMYGESLGAGVNSELALKRRVCASIVDSGFTSLADIGQESVPLYRMYPAALMPAVALDTRKTSGNLPTLIIHGKNDTTVPFHHAEKIHAAIAGSQLVELPQSSHNNIDQSDQVVAKDAICKFFSNLGNSSKDSSVTEPSVTEPNSKESNSKEPN